MKYYKPNAMPNKSGVLEDVSPSPGSYVYDEYGNLLAFDMFGKSLGILVKTVLEKDNKITSFENPRVALHGFWALSMGKLIKQNYGINI